MNSKVQGPQCSVWTVHQRFLHSHQCTRTAGPTPVGKAGVLMCRQHAKIQAAKEERWTGEAYRRECEALKRQASIQEEAKILCRVILESQADFPEARTLASLVLQFGLNLESVGRKP
jgi:hypothetical protein